MTIVTTGTIILSVAPICEKCGQIMPQFKYQNTLKCCNCGATFTTTKREIKDNEIEIEFNFDGFECMHKTYNNECKNTCPAPDMFCKEHCSDGALGQANSNLKYYENYVEQSKEKINKIEESKKVWLIQEMSGIE